MRLRLAAGCSTTVPLHWMRCGIAMVEGKGGLLLREKQRNRTKGDADKTLLQAERVMSDGLVSRYQSIFSACQLGFGRSNGYTNAR